VTQRRAAIAAWVAALAVAGCVGDGPPQASTGEMAARPPNPQASAKQSASTSAAIASLPADAIDREVAPPTAPELPGPTHLVGLSDESVETLLGAPTFRRRDPPAEVWRYAGEACRLFVFLYARQDDPSDYRVTHIEIRSASVVKALDNDCFHSLLKGQPRKG
jgi:hypothetical protein